MASVRIRRRASVAVPQEITDELHVVESAVPSVRSLTSHASMPSTRSTTSRAEEREGDAQRTATASPHSPPHPSPPVQPGVEEVGAVAEEEEKAIPAESPAAVTQERCPSQGSPVSPPAASPQRLKSDRARRPTTSRRRPSIVASLALPGGDSKAASERRRASVSRLDHQDQQCFTLPPDARAWNGDPAEGRDPEGVGPPQRSSSIYAERGADADVNDAEEEEFHEEEIVDHLDVIDPAVSTLSHLTNMQNAIVFPPLTALYSRTPVMDLPSRSEEEQSEDVGAPLTKSTATPEERKRAVSDVSTAFPLPAGRHRSSIVEPDGEMDMSDLQPLEPILTRDPLDDHVYEMLTRKQKVRRRLDGLWAYLKTPMGIITAIYGICVVFWGSAIVLFLLRWINLHNKHEQDKWIEISCQVVNGLFTVTGVGLIPWRAMDTYYIIRIAHYQHLTWRLRRERQLPKLEDPNDLPRTEEGMMDEHEYKKVEVLSPRQQAKLLDIQKKFKNSQSWYRANETSTHRAFPISYALAICLLTDGNSFFQCILCGVMWGLRYYNRPAWTTGSLIPLSFLCGIGAAVLIWKGGEKTKKKEEVEQMLLDAFDADQMEQQHRGQQEQKGEGASSSGTEERDCGDKPSYSLLSSALACPRPPNLIMAGEAHPAPLRHLPLLLITLVFLLLLRTISRSFLETQSLLSQEKGCRMSWMSPSYVRQVDFDHRWTRLSRKYSLWLYREVGYDRGQEPTGTPALFIPGNAGSYAQVRSIASSSARQFYSLHDGRQEIANPAIVAKGVKNLDWFTVDFNEDFSAFHGPTLQEQAEYLNDAIRYVRSLYPSSSNLTVPLVGHSMGGVVARLMPLSTNYEPGSVSSIVTLSTPHVVPPVPFDRRIERIYSTINRAWQSLAKSDPAEEQGAAPHPLKDTLLVSIAGGASDTQINSDPTTLYTIAPASHSLSLFTTNMPRLWSCVDHLAMAWCDQLRERIARGVLEGQAWGPGGVGGSGRTGEELLRRRREGWRRLLLAGVGDKLEDSDRDRKHEGIQIVHVDGDTVTVPFKSQFSWPSPSQAAPDPSKSYVFPFDASRPAHFTLLTNVNIEEPSDLLVQLCASVHKPTASPSDDGSQLANDQEVLECQRVSPNTFTILPPTRSDASGMRTFPSPDEYYIGREVDRWLDLSLEDVLRGRTDKSATTFVRVKFLQGVEGMIGSFVRAGWTLEEERRTVVSASKLGMAIRGVSLTPTMAGKSSVFTEFEIPAMDSSLLAYNLHIERSSCGVDHRAFRSLLRHFTPSTNDARYFPLFDNTDVEDIPIGFHASSPFLPRRSSMWSDNALRLQVWRHPDADPSCLPEFDKAVIRINWFATAGRMVMRYRIAGVALPIAIVGLAARKQWAEFGSTGHFPPFFGALSAVARETLPLFLAASCVLPILQAWLLSGPLSDRSSTSLTSSIFEDILLGNDDAFFWWLVPLGVLLAVGIVACVGAALEALVWCAARLMRLVRAVGWPRDSVDLRRPQQWASMALLFLLVATYLPYQFAFLSAFLLHLVTCARSSAAKYSLSPSPSSTPAHPCSPFAVRQATNRAHYHASLLHLMLWLLPIVAPVLVVWVRNLMVNWREPFSSDHNVLQIAPVLLLIHLTGAGRGPVRLSGLRTMNLALTGLLLTISLFALLFGVRHTYLLYYLVNLFFSLLIFSHWRGSPSLSSSFSYAGLAGEEDDDSEVPAAGAAGDGVVDEELK